MLQQERILVWQFNRGSKKALRRIYERYKDDLLGLAMVMLRDRSEAEDVVHDVFVSFARSVGKFRLTGSLKGYLSICVANCARDRNRGKAKQNARLEKIAEPVGELAGPSQRAIADEQNRSIETALAGLSYEQREVVVLHLQYDMRFARIAESQGISINTVQSRYRYGLDKLKSMLNGEVT